MAIQAVIFDMGGTIETFNHTRELRLKAIPGLRQILETAGIVLPLTDEQLLDTISAGLRRYHHWRLQTLVELPTAQIWRAYIFADTPNVPDTLAAIAEELTLYVETRFYERAMRPEIPTVLAAIRQMGLKIGLISNVSSRGQVPYSLKHYGIEGYFDPIVLSSEDGRRKPDPAIFHHAARLINAPTSECLYVGDRIARDIIGARRAGYGLAVQIHHDYQHGENDEGATPDAVIENMAELLDIIQAANAPQVTPAPEGVRAILFDAGDILYYRPNRGRQLAAFLRELSITIEDNHLSEKRALTEQAFIGQISQDQYRRATLQAYGVTDSEQLARGLQILDEEDNDVCFFEGVSATLAALKQKGYWLGIITDTANPVHVKLNWFEQGGFGAVWDSIISSCEMGVRKPHPAIYHAALRQLGLQPGQTVFVGHKASELAGARAVGMKTVAFNYDPEAQADVYIEHFADLLNIPL
jgi:putative hydrolase of the HAD superfamily